MLGVIFEFIGAIVLFILNHIASLVFRTKRKTFREIMYDESMLTVEKYSTGLKNRTIGIAFLIIVIIIVKLAF